MTWLSGWSKRKAITLTGGSSGALTDYQLALAITYDSDMQSDFDDLRFADPDGNLIDAWLEDKTDSTSADVWVEFPSTPANTVEQTYYMYYDKSDASSDWDIGATFLFGDDFPGSSLDTNKWDTGGTVSVADSKVTLSGTNAYISGKTSFGLGYAIRGYGKLDKGTSDEASINFKSLLSYTNIIQLRAYYNEADDKFRLKSAKDSTWGDGVFSVATNEYVYHYFEIQRKDASTYYALIDSEELTGTTSVPTADLPANLHSKGSSNEAEFDWIVVRKYAANPPTYEFGSEENAPTGATPMGVFTGCFGRPLGGII